MNEEFDVVKLKDFVVKNLPYKLLSLKDLFVKDLKNFHNNNNLINFSDLNDLEKINPQIRNLYLFNDTLSEDINLKQIIKASDVKRLKYYFTIKSWNELKLYHSLKQIFNEGLFASNLIVTNKSFKNSEPKFLKQINILTNFNNNIKQKQTFKIYYPLGNYPQLSDSIKQKNNYIIQDILSWSDNKIKEVNIEEDFHNALSKTIEKAEKEYPEQTNDLIQKIISKIKQGGDSYKNIIYNTYQNWALQAGEKQKITEIEQNINIASYHETFLTARSLSREFLIYVGPTNSGKTYSAMKELCNANNGAYLAPLRLMALEGQETLFENGVLASLITGEEQKILPKSTHVSSTVEMVNLNKIIDCAVIDEIQMITDDQRGWAWSTALIGVPAKKVVLVGAEEALPHIIPIIEALGEKYTIKHFERKNQLIVKHQPMHSLKDLHPGDAVITFKRKQVLKLKQTLEAENIKTSVIYGSLSPEVRRMEAQKFKNGESDVLIATDAIGMGLNLPIHRIFFSEINKPTKNQTSRPLTTSEIKQIAGRAGRYGLSEKGIVGTFLTIENQEEVSQLLFDKLHEKPVNEFQKLNIMPTVDHLKTLSTVLKTNNIFVVLEYFQNKIIKDSTLFKVSNLENILEIAYSIQRYNLPLDVAYSYCCAPIDLKVNMHFNNLKQWVKLHKEKKEISSYLLLDSKSYDNNIERELFLSENIIKICTAYKWLSYKFPEIYTDVKNIEKLYQEQNNKVENLLNTKLTIKDSYKL